MTGVELVEGPQVGAFSFGNRWRCFYCRCHLLPVAHWDGVGPVPANLATVDHVYPLAMLSGVEASDWWRRRNKVRACGSCNERKGSRHPVRWLAMLGDPDARDRLATRLLALDRHPDGFHRAVFAADFPPAAFRRSGLVAPEDAARRRTKSA